MKPSSIAALSPLVLLTACERDESFPPVKEPEVPGLQSTRPAASISGAGSEHALLDIEQKLKELDQKLEEFDKGTSAATDDVRVRSQEALARLREKRAEAGRRTEELRSASAERWRELKVALDGALAELDKGINDAKSPSSPTSPVR